MRVFFSIIDVMSFFTERKLVDSIQSHFERILEEFDLTDVIDALVSKKCLTPAQHRKVRETEGHLGAAKVLKFR